MFGFWPCCLEALKEQENNLYEYACTCFSIYHHNCFGSRLMSITSFFSLLSTETYHFGECYRTRHLCFFTIAINLQKLRRPISCVFFGSALKAMI